MKVLMLNFLFGFAAFKSSTSGFKFSLSVIGNLKPQIEQYFEFRSFSAWQFEQFFLINFISTYFSFVLKVKFLCVMLFQVGF
jgi:hypothetical protein